MSTPEPAPTEAPPATPPAPAPTPPAPTPTPPAAPRQTGSDSSDLMDALNALPEKIAETFREMAAPAATAPTPAKGDADSATDDEKPPPVKKTPAKAAPPAQEPPRTRTFADKWFGK